MKTCCPECQTTFRVTPEQLKARAGKVRCGQCQTVFNALDSLIEETIVAQAPSSSSSPVARSEPQASATEAPGVPVSGVAADVGVPSAPPAPLVPSAPSVPSAPTEILASNDASPAPAIDASLSVLLEPALPSSAGLVAPPVAARVEPQSTVAEAPAAVAPDPALETPADALTETEAQALGKATGLILPREMTEVPGYSKWSAGVMAAPIHHQEAEKPARWPYVLVAILLSLALLGQLVFRFRGELAVRLPSVRPALEAFSTALGASIPLSRRIDSVSIESSDLQSDTARGNLLVLSATVRNRAAYAQAYPSLELALTDTQDTPIARRVFMPEEYLPAAMRSDPAFAAHSDVAVRLWIEAKDISAAGYRLYVFYP